MRNFVNVAICAVLLAGHARATELPVEPYAVADGNAGVRPERDDRLYRALGGRDGVARIAARIADRNRADPRIADIFHAMDRERFVRTLGEHLCFVAGGGCAYTGRDMASAHRDMGIQTRHFAAVVENLEWAMREEGVSNANQNRLLAKLAPLKRTIVER